MAQLSTIVGSILRDFIQAQHEANCYSLSLSREYGKHGRIKDFQLPNAVIGDLEFELKYAVKGEGKERDGYETDYPQLRRFFRDISGQFAKIVITSIVSTVSGAFIGVDDGYENFQKFMKKEETLKNEFCAFLSRKIQGTLTERTGEIITLDGQIDNEMLLVFVMETVRSEFLEHPDLEELFSGKSGDDLKAETEDNLKYSLGGLMNKLASDFNCVRKHSYPSVDIILTADSLQKLPDEAIQCIRFRVTQREMDEELRANGENV